MLSQVVINQGNFDLQNRAENVVQTVVHCFSITSTNKLIINKIIPLSQSPLGSQEDLSNRRKPLKINDFWRFYFLPPTPNRRNILQYPVCKKGAGFLVVNLLPATQSYRYFSMICVDCNTSYAAPFREQDRKPYMGNVVHFLRCTTIFGRLVPHLFQSIVTHYSG